MYRSTDKEYMEELKKTVLSVTKGDPREERRYGLNYLRRHIRIDDLHRHALKSFPKEEIVFGKGSYAPKVVVVTNRPIHEDEEKRLDQVWSRLKLSPDDLYYAHVRFVSTGKRRNKRIEIIGTLLDILNPNAVLVFDDLMIETKAKIIEAEMPSNVLRALESKEDRVKLTSKLKEIRTLLKN